MSDYDKLTVVKLRDELVKRGLPKSGLKAVLVNRLIEADASSESAPVAPHGQGANESAQSDNKDTIATRSPPEAQGQTNVEGDVSIVNDAPPVPIAEVDRIVNHAVSNGAVETTIEPEQIVQQELKTVDIMAQDNDSASQVPNKQEVENNTVSYLPVEIPLEVPRPTKDLASQMEGVEQQNNGSSLHQASLEVSNNAAEPPQAVSVVFTQGSLSRQELLEDTNKRKRRSQSPPPSSVETSQKRAKADDGRPHVKLPEDAETSNTSFGNVSQSGGNDDIAGVPTTPVIEDTAVNGHAPLDAINTKKEENLTADGVQTEPKFDQKETPSLLAVTESPTKPSPSDTRFKNLFTAPSKREGSPLRHAPDLDNDDRAITPAIHPATSALYIRDLLRPLQPGNLKDHLIALATPPGSDPDSKIITEFHLDSIRTHCLIGFANTSAAARVRSSLHDRVWPDERTRKPLWVDFIPEEKLKKWIEVESDTSARKSQAAKRWEVVYEEETDGLKAYLQEAGSNSNAPRPGPPLPSRTEAGKGVQGAPSGPRIRDVEPRSSQQGAVPRLDSGKGFQALDDLFKSTAAKPKLYYLPVKTSLADRRLDMLAAGRGGGRSDEMRRFTFEENTIVDRGPEFGSRGRGGYGGRGGGYGGGYQGRGGGWRGDRRDRR